jgi:hypothetical protein
MTMCDDVKTRKTQVFTTTETRSVSTKEDCDQKNCDDTCAYIKEEYQKELTVFAQCSDKNLTGIRNALLRPDTETSSVATAPDGTTVDSAGSQEVGDVYESVGVPVAATTAGEDDSRIVMDVLGVSMAPGQDEGHNSATAGAHPEVVVDGISEVEDAGEILLPQQVTSSAAVQVPPIHLASLQPASPPTIRLVIPTGSSHSSDDSELEGSQCGATTVSTPNTSTRAQEHSSADETSIFATPGEVQPNRMGQLTTDSEDLHTELRLGLAQIGAKMKILLQTLTESTSKLTTVDQTVQTV